MRLIQRTAPGEIGINYMWLPTWIGMNAALLGEIEAHLAKEIVGRSLDADTLDIAHRAVLSFLVERFPDTAGLFDYLDGIKYVEEHDQQSTQRGAAPPQGG